MRIWLISQHFTPEEANPAARLKGFAKEWQKHGAEVFALTATPLSPEGALHPDYHAKPAFFKETIEGLKVCRHWAYHHPDRSSKTRILAQITFALSLLRNFFWGRPPAPNAIVVSTPSLVPAFSAWLLARIYRAGFIFEARDPWPEKFIELGRLKDSRVIDFLVKLQLFLLKRADVIIVPSLALEQSIAGLGIPADKIQIISDGLEDAHIGNALNLRKKEVGHSLHSLRTTLQISPMTKVVMHMGSLGIAQAGQQILDAATIFLSRSDVVFLLVGNGSDKDRLKERAIGMPNVQFLSTPRTEEEKWQYYGLADVCLITTKDIASMKKITPPRVYEALGVGRPTVAAVAGTAATLLNEARTALVTPPEDGKKLAYAILKLIDNPEKAELLGEKAQNWVQAKFNHSRLAYTYLAHIKNTAKGI